MMANRMISLLLLLLLPAVCQSFNNLVGNIVSKVSNVPKEAPRDTEMALLEEFGLDSSSTEPKPFSARPQQIPALLAASLPAVFRLGTGVFANGYSVALTTKRASEYSGFKINNIQLKESCEKGRTSQLQPLVLYEFEACPFCRKVREAVSLLSLTVTYRPCPKNGQLYRREIKTLYGEGATFPYLEDPNTGIQMFESDQILDYLFKTYGNAEIPWTLGSNPLVPLTAGLGLIFGGGGSYRSNNAPQLPIEFWSYEGSPFCKLVREQLCELEVAHTQVSCPRGSDNRQRMLDEKGRFQVPYIEDPNTGVKLFESEAIMLYLKGMYGVAETPIKYL